MGIGSVAVASEGSISVRRNPTAFQRRMAAAAPASGAEAWKDTPYLVFDPIPSDAALNRHLLATYAANPKVKDRVVPCLNCTADSFYSSQGRQDVNFEDDNAGLIDSIVASYPSCTTLEMESFHFLDMALSCRPIGCMRATASTIVLAQRRTNAFIDPETAEMLEARLNTCPHMCHQCSDLTFFLTTLFVRVHLMCVLILHACACVWVWV